MMATGNTLARQRESCIFAGFVAKCSTKTSNDSRGLSTYRKRKVLVRVVAPTKLVK